VPNQCGGRSVDQRKALEFRLVPLNNGFTDSKGAQDLQKCKLPEANRSPLHYVAVCPRNLGGSGPDSRLFYPLNNPIAGYVPLVAELLNDLTPAMASLASLAVFQQPGY